MSFTAKGKPANSDSRDECVREIAEELAKEKWHVKADLPGFEKPEKVGSFLPMLEAQKKGCMRRICEVVTEDMFGGDQERYQEVKNYCDEYDFHFYVVGKDGKHREVDPNIFGKK